jgi:hypothetical protein
MTRVCCNDKRRRPIRLHRKIDVAVNVAVGGDKLRYDESMPLGGYFEERRASIYVSGLKINSASAMLSLGHLLHSVSEQGFLV